MSSSSETRVRELVASGDSTRLDRFLAEQERELTRSRIHSLIGEGLVTLNGRVARPAQKVKTGDRVILTIPPVRESDLVPQDIPIEVVYQDSDIVVIDKPAGLSVHPGPGHPDGTLVNALLARCPDIQGVGGVHRPGIVHRLDKDTSGLIVVAKTEKAHHDISSQIKRREVHKGYMALTVGVPPQDSGTVDAPIARDPRHRQRMAVVLGGRESRTHFRVVKELEGHALLSLTLETGRTHQIRVHLAYLGYPIYGDEVYGRRSSALSRQFLHANALEFLHPRTGERMSFHSALPRDLNEAMESLIHPSGSAH
ncbi:MAG: RluA family pseudouridine synthase [Chloroflexota bacterium]|nr:RluA family pseudouridine synthase [Chloroflexota bacterium]